MIEEFKNVMGYFFALAKPYKGQRIQEMEVTTLAMTATSTNAIESGAIFSFRPFSPQLRTYVLRTSRGFYTIISGNGTRIVTPWTGNEFPTGAGCSDTLLLHPTAIGNQNDVPPLSCGGCLKIVETSSSSSKSILVATRCSKCQRDFFVPFGAECLKFFPPLRPTSESCSVLSCVCLDCHKSASEPLSSSTSTGTSAISVRTETTSANSARLQSININYQNYVQAMRSALGHARTLNALLPRSDTIVHLMIDRGDWDLISSVTDLNLLNRANSMGQTPIHCAIAAKQIALVRDLANRGVDLTGWDYDGKTALHYAAQFGDLEIFTLLLETGADLTQTTLLGFTIGHLAAFYHNCLILRHLDAIGFDLNRADNMYQRTPIMVAAFRGNLSGVQFLYERGYPTDILDVKGYNLGVAAVCSKNLELVIYLHQRGIDCRFKEFKIHSLIWAMNLRADPDFCRSLVDQINFGTDPFEGYGCCCLMESTAPHLYEAGRCLSLLEQTLGSKMPHRTELTALLLSRGVGYTYNRSADSL